MDEPNEIQEPRVRPGGVSVIAVLAILFGVAGICCLPLGIVQMFVAADPINAAIRNSSAFYFNVAIYSIGWITSIISTLLGFGLWGVKEWARKGTVVYLLFMILYSIAMTAVSSIFFIPTQVEIALAGQGMPASNKDAAVWIAIAFQAGIACVATIIYALIVVYLTRPKVKAVFQGTE